MFDFIGDIHGHADKLESLLEKLGYKIQGGVYQHPQRKVFFLGDFIDRGPKILEVLNIVIPMVSSGSAQCVMGNHEYNYLSFHTPTKSGEGYLRPRSDKNTKQCAETINQLSGTENERLLKWIWEIPLWFENDSFAAIHACWDQPNVGFLKKETFDNKLNLSLLHSSAVKNTPAYQAIENLLKGKEVPLPPELYFHDKDKHERKEARVCWWDVRRKVLIPNRDESLLAKIEVPDTPISKPTFFGHYWERGTPSVTNPLAVCLDYSVAKDGHLCAYRFDGEKELTSDKLVWV